MFVRQISSSHAGAKITTVSRYTASLKLGKMYGEEHLSKHYYIIQTSSIVQNMSKRLDSGICCENMVFDLLQCDLIGPFSWALGNLAHSVHLKR